MKSLPNIQEQIKILGSELNVMSDMLKSIDDVCFLKDDESKGLGKLSKKISEQHLYNSYSGINKYLAEKDEYQKSLYIRMLCVVVQYGDPIENGQEAYLQKLIKDCQLENKLEDFLREALCFDIEEFKAFIEVFGETVLSCYFCIDSLILVSFEQNSEEKYNLLADIFCALGITKDELQFLSKVSCSVVEQKGELFDEAKESVPDSVEDIDFSFYVKDFYEGVLEYDNICHFYSSTLTMITESEIADFEDLLHGWFKFNDNNFVFEGKIISLMLFSKQWYFDNCNSVKFIECIIYADYSFAIYSCGEVIFEDCILISFDLFRVQGSESVHFSNCEFAKYGSSYLFLEYNKKVVLENNNFYGVYSDGLQKPITENGNNWYYKKS